MKFLDLGESVPDITGLGEISFQTSLFKTIA